VKICLISSGYIQKDPRYYFLANSLKKANHEVILVNIYLDARQLPISQGYSSSKFKILTDYNVLNINFFNYIPSNFTPQSSDFFVSNWYEYVPTFVNQYMEKNGSEKFLEADVFYGLELFFGSAMSQQFASVTNKRFIVDFKELFSELCRDYPKESINTIKAIEEKCINDAWFVPCVSQKIIDFYKQKYNVNQEKFILLENSKPCDNLVPDFSRVKRDKVKFIASAGTANKSRGFNELAEIWELLDPDNATLDLRISNITDQEKKQIIKIGKKTYAKTLNFIPPVLEDEMTESLLEYDCGIIPYLPDAGLNERYCCPNKFGQYMNAGLAIVSSNTEYITERISKYNLGIIYNPNDINGSVENFKNLIDNRDQLIEKRINAYNFCKEKYEWGHQVQALLTKLKSSI
jgi:glycosyltransferase involved in cell wall biosynthesis